MSVTIFSKLSTLTSKVVDFFNNAWTPLLVVSYVVLGLVLLGTPGLLDIGLFVSISLAYVGVKRQEMKSKPHTVTYDASLVPSNPHCSHNFPHMELTTIHRYSFLGLKRSTHIRETPVSCPDL